MAVSALDEVTAYVRSRLAAELGRGTSMRALAVKLKSTHVTLGNIRDRKSRTIDSELLERIARHFGMTMPVLYQEAHAWAPKHRDEIGLAPESAVTLVLDDRYPNRAIAAEFAVAQGVSRAAVDRVLAQNNWSTDRTPMEWYEEMRAEDVLIKREGQRGAAIAQSIEQLEKERPEDATDQRIADIKRRRAGQSKKA